MLGTPLGENRSDTPFAQFLSVCFGVTTHRS